MDIQHIKELIDLMEERSLAQLEVEADNEKVAITRHLPQATIMFVRSEEGGVVLECWLFC